MKIRLFALLAAFVLLMGIPCRASTARQYPELACSGGVMQYHIVRGDTLSEIAEHYKPHGMKLYGPKGAVAQLVDIYQNTTGIDTTQGKHYLWVKLGGTLVLPWCTRKQSAPTTDSTVSTKKTVLSTTRSAHVPGTMNLAKPERVEPSYTFVVDVEYALVPDPPVPAISYHPVTQPPVADSNPVTVAATATPPVRNVSSNEGTTVRSLTKGWYRMPVHSSNLPTGMFHPALFVDNPTDSGWKTYKDVDRFVIVKKDDGTESVLISFPERVTVTSRFDFIVEDDQGNPQRFTFTGSNLLQEGVSIPAPNLKNAHFTNDAHFQEDKLLLRKYRQKAPRNIARPLYTYAMLAGSHAAILYNPFAAIPAVINDVRLTRNAVQNHRAAKQQQQQALLASQSNNLGGNQ